MTNQPQPIPTSPELVEVVELAIYYLRRDNQENPPAALVVGSEFNDQLRLTPHSDQRIDYAADPIQFVGIPVTIDDTLGKAEAQIRDGAGETMAKMILSPKA